MSVQREDFRTNRADYLIAATKDRSAADVGRVDVLERQKKTLWLRDPRAARLAANPCESLPAPRALRRGN